MIAFKSRNELQLLDMDCQLVYGGITLPTNLYNP
jgi:hypothetical protein